jgi:hypothetical protein
MRQGFVLLSDALGVSMLVDAINHRLPGNATHGMSYEPLAAPFAGCGR